MKWITRSHVHVDRVACPWLITRFIDSDAEFLFVPKSRVLNVAEKEGAIAFDTPGAELHHREDLCTFDVIIKDYGLTDKALFRMAKIINAADTNRPDNDLLAAGFEAIAVGYSLRYPDDLENLEHQFEVYDALYAWCRLDVASRE
ncbi:MAG: chromate resistance protein ChrB domain-containing protein [Pseudomonadota bacterium]